MKKMLWAWLMLTSAAVAQVTLNDGKVLGFGDALADVATRLGEKTFEVERGRSGVDRMIATTSVQLTFDEGKLQRMSFNVRHALTKPLAPFAEAWRNFTPIGSAEIQSAMSREDFEKYLAAWKRRAEAAGKWEKVDYWIGGDANRASVTFGPRRKLWGTGSLTGDAWVFSFPETSTGSGRSLGGSGEGRVQFAAVHGCDAAGARREGTHEEGSGGGGAEDRGAETGADAAGDALNGGDGGAWKGRGAGRGVGDSA